MRKEKRITWLMFFSILFCFSFILAAASKAEVVNVIDSDWMKTSNVAVESDAQLGTTAYPATDPFWSWTPVVWDGPAQNGFGVSIPGYVPGDYWSYWLHSGAGLKDSHWFSTNLKVCDPTLLNEIRLIKKYPGTDILSINDDLYVWVNGTPAAAGGTACISRLSTVVEPFRSMFSCATKGGNATETDDWLINGGLTLPTTLFHDGDNRIEILTDELHLWGGVGHLVFKVVQSAACNVNNRVEFNPLPETYKTTTDATGCPTTPKFKGKFSFEAVLVNKSSDKSPLSDLVVEVKTLTNGNLLQNADGGPGGVGAILTVPEKDGYSDGILDPWVSPFTEFVRIPFIICLKEIKPFSFFVDVLGIVE